MHRKRTRKILGIWEKSGSWVLGCEQESQVLASGEDDWLSGLAEVARGDVCGGADGKVVIERLCISLPYVWKPFNSKVIKSFVPELGRRQVFFVFRDCYVIYIRVMTNHIKAKLDNTLKITCTLREDRDETINDRMWTCQLGGLRRYKNLGTREYSKKRKEILTATFIFTNPSTRSGYDTRSIFKQSLTGLNSEFSFS